eukprot:TRINITY_DN34514_c0_g1_i1.p1 TRINITY_DN34514_c0_g1~~TRINITY_DN34514_c0_g1_i1.p1  ORF type:complete len:335 (+),score=58.43 TRINITY_DN34514_c0_g1_i1:34-1038(+)
MQVTYLRLSISLNFVLLVACLWGTALKDAGRQETPQIPQTPPLTDTGRKRRLGCLLKDPDTGETLDKGGEFLKIATQFNGTDKVFPTHHYEAMYAKYLDGLRGGDVRMLEIGLGCNMPAGPGHSTHLWKRYFGEKLQYYVLEYTMCMDKWKKTLEEYKVEGKEKEWYDVTMGNRTYWGDQADPERLKTMMQGIGGLLDVVLDDGGHSMVQQITSFEHLFPFLAPGGVYIIEDLETSFYKQDTWGGTAAAQAAQRTTVGYLQRLLTDLHWRTENGPVGSHHAPTMWAHWVRSIDCDRMVCVVTKRLQPFAPARTADKYTWPCRLSCRGEYCSCAF